MKITSPQKNWKTGDIFVSILVTSFDICRVIKALDDRVTYEVIAGRQPVFKPPFFTFDSMGYLKNDFFRIVDDKKRAFDLIFKVPISR